MPCSAARKRTVRPRKARLFAHRGDRVGQLGDRLVARDPVGLEVVLAAEPVVLNAGDVRDGRVDGPGSADICSAVAARRQSPFAVMSHHVPFGTVLLLNIYDRP